MANNLKVLEIKKTKGPKQDSQNQQPYFRTILTGLHE
jgi:hypothetical protein